MLQNVCVFMKLIVHCLKAAGFETCSWKELPVCDSGKNDHFEHDNNDDDQFVSHHSGTIRNN